MCIEGTTVELPAEVIHRMHNLHGEDTGLTLHLYSPPLVRQGVYRVIDGQPMLRMVIDGGEELRPLTENEDESFALSIHESQRLGTGVKMSENNSIDPITTDELLAEARAGLTRRLTAAQAHAAAAAGGVLVDIRPVAMRARDGEIPGAVVIDRNVLEWRGDPVGSHRDPRISDPGRKVILFCDEGYASSLAAQTLCRLGLDATDMIGGVQAWRRAGLPVTSGERTDR